MYLYNLNSIFQKRLTIKIKIVLMIFLAAIAISCDDDFRQGSCEEGFYEQNDGNGGFFCAPIFEVGLDEPTNSKINTFSEKD